MKNSDLDFIRQTTLLECAVAENLNISDLRIFVGKSHWYIISKEIINGKPAKVYFKKSL
jgi:hypothetical protein